MDISYNYSVCEHCSNNPKNNLNASGICCCSLPYMTTTGTATTNTYTYGTTTTYEYVPKFTNTTQG